MQMQTQASTQEIKYRITHDNTWARLDMEFLFECLTRQLTSKGNERVGCRVEQVTTNFSYQHNNPLLTRKVDSINE